MSNSNKKAFSKAPTAPTALSLIVSLGMLAVLLLFQNGILFSLGFTDVTSDIIVMAITVALAVCAVLSLIAMVSCVAANSHNKELVGSVAAKTVYRKDDSEQHNRHGDEKASVAEKARDEEVHESAEAPKAAEEMPEPQEVKEPVMDNTPAHEPISPIVTAMVNDSVSSETLDDIANMMNGTAKEPEAERSEESEQDEIPEQYDQPAEDEQPEAAPAEEMPEESAEPEEDNEPATEETPAAEPKAEAEQTESVVNDEPVELTKFEQAMISLMKRGNIPENVYAIEEYKEGAVCLIRDDAHYFVYDCKDNQAQDVEMFEANKEKEIATTFATRIHEKLSKGA